MTQPQVARLERGDVNPLMDTLVRVAAGLGIELTISVTPANRKPRLVTKRALADNMVGGIRTAPTCSSPRRGAPSAANASGRDPVEHEIE
jgi:transcriptional regulator with XRE-family HTH domain